MRGDINIGELLMQYFCLLFSLSVHEAAHAAMANYRGDDTARLLGRLTLNPVKHIDPLGTVILPLLMYVTVIPYLFGWAKPVPFQPYRLKDMRRDPVLIAIAGPASNLLIALAGVVVFRILLLVGGEAAEGSVIGILFMITWSMIVINVLLMLFNVIPVPPLDGHYVLDYFLPPGGQRVLQQIGPFGIIIAIFAGQYWLGWAMPPVLNALWWLIQFPNHAV